MARPQIPKEQILDAGLQLIIKEGHEKLSISAVGKEMNRSTKLISWMFGSMENYRSELAEYALQYFNSRLVPDGDNPVKGFASVGITYVELAYEAPNLLRFIHANSSKIASKGGLGFVFDEEKNVHLKEALMHFTGMDEKHTLMFMTTVVTFSQGIVSFILDGTISYEKDVAKRMLIDCGIVQMVYGGVPEEKAKAFLGKSEEKART